MKKTVGLAAAALMGFGGLASGGAAQAAPVAHDDGARNGMYGCISSQEYMMIRRNTEDGYGMLQRRIERRANVEGFVKYKVGSDKHVRYRFCGGGRVSIWYYLDYNGWRSYDVI